MGELEPIEDKEGILGICLKCRQRGLCSHCGTSLEVEREVWGNVIHSCKGDK